MNLEKKQYIITQDTFGIYKNISQGRFSIPTDSITKYTSEVKEIIQRGVSPSNEVEVSLIDEKIINKELNQLVEAELLSNPDSICVCLDRFLLPNLQENPNFKSRFFRFGINRNINNEKVPRIGSDTFKNQLDNLASTVTDIENKTVILVDDGLFSGSTMKTVKDLFSTIKVKEENIKVICFLSNQNVPQDSSNVQIARLIPNLFEWVDMRDFSIFGGKLIQSNKRNSISLAEPYISPWSNGESASINNENFLDTSKQLILAQKELIIDWQKSLGSDLKFKDLISKGFPLPFNRNKSISININTSLVDYLDTCLKQINNELKKNL